MKMLRYMGTAGAGVLALAGQFLVSLRADSAFRSVVPGIALYVAAFVLLIVSLWTGRSSAPSGPSAPGSPASGSPAPESPASGSGQTERFLAGRAGWILLALIVVGGAWLRLYRIDIIPRGLNNDEAINCIEVKEIVAGKPFATVTRRGLNRETMFHYLASLSYRNSGFGLNFLRALPALFGLNPRVIRDPMTDLIFPLRAVSIGVGTLTILLLYFFARATFGARAGLFAAFFLAVSPWHLLYSRVGFRTILAPPFAILTVWLFLRALRTGKWFDHLAWGVAAGLGCWTYTSFRAVPMALLGYAGWRWLASLRAARPGASGRPQGAPGREVLIGALALAVLFAGIMAMSNMTPAEFLARGAYAATPPQTNWALNLLSTITMLNYSPGRYAVIQSDAFISDGVSTVFGLVGLEPDTLLMAAFATLGLIAAAWQRIGPGGGLIGRIVPRPAAAGEDSRQAGAASTALTVVLLCIVVAWLTVGWLGPSLTRMLLNLPWLCLLAALFAVRIWDDLADWRPPLTEWAAGALMIAVAILGLAQGVSNYFVLAGRSERAMQHFGATQTIMGMFVRSLPPDQDVVVLHTLRVDTLRYLIGDRTHVELLTDTSKVSLDGIVNVPRTITFVVEYARQFADPLRALMTRFPLGDMSQVADARFDPDKPIFFTFTLWKDAAGNIIPSPEGPAGPPPGLEMNPPPDFEGAPGAPGAPPGPGGSPPPPG